MGTDDEPAPLRSDALARRARVVQAAAELFADEGVEVPMQRIAQAAGVGVGTLYRRFPDRSSLLVAVLTEAMVQVRDRIRRALASDLPAWEAFVGDVARPDQTAMALRARLARSPELARELKTHPEVQAVQQEVAEALTELVAAAQAEGSLRADLGAGDVALMLRLLGRATPAGASPEILQRQRTLILDALSTGRHTPLPGAPASIADIWGPETD